MRKEEGNAEDREMNKNKKMMEIQDVCVCLFDLWVGGS